MTDVDHAQWDHISEIPKASAKGLILLGYGYTPIDIAPKPIPFG